MSEPQDSSSARGSRTARSSRWRKIVAIQIAVVVGGVLALELGARAWLRIRREPYDPGETRREANQLLELNRDFIPRSRGDGTVDLTPHDDPDQERVLHPYLGWEVAYGNREMNAEYLSLRAGEFTDALNVAIVGGSVAAGFTLDSMGWGKMREILSADPRFAARKLHVLNFGRGGFKEPQQINFVLYAMGLGFKPDVVLNIDGFNEVALGNNNHAEGTHPAFPSAAHWAHLVMWGTSDRTALDKVEEVRVSQRALEAWGAALAAWRLEESCVLGKLVLHRMYRLRRESVDRFEDYGKYLADRRNGSTMHGPPLEGGEKEAVAASVECWKECSRSLSDICRARGIVYIHVLQPTLHDTGSKPLTAKEIAHGKVNDSWMHGVKLGYPLLRQEGEDLRRSGVDFIDASMIFEKRNDDLYTDCCHFVKAGHELLAETIAPELIRRLTEKR